MKYFYGAFLLVVITATSCKNDETAKNQGDARLIVPFTQQTAITNSTTSAPAQTSDNHNLFHESNAVATTTVLGGINPAHGQPNHRCDIAVGAPLNSTANGTASTQSTNTQTQNSTGTYTVNKANTTAAKTTTPKGMNPQHGEKNHRCDIAVGAPLNSKVAAAVSQNSGQVSQKIDVQPAIPSLLATSSADTETPEGMNPAHGKDGHRCDIAVGAPLPKS